MYINPHESKGQSSDCPLVHSLVTEGYLATNPDYYTIALLVAFIALTTVALVVALVISLFVHLCLFRP